MVKQLIPPCGIGKAWRANPHQLVPSIFLEEPASITGAGSGVSAPAISSIVRAKGHPLEHVEGVAAWVVWPYDHKKDMAHLSSNPPGGSHALWIQGDRGVSNIQPHPPRFRPGGFMSDQKEKGLSREQACLLTKLFLRPIPISLATEPAYTTWPLH